MSNSTDLTKMTKDELIALTEKLTKKVEESKANGPTVKQKVLALLNAGYTDTDSICAELEISSKNLSSNLTYLRKDLINNGETIITQPVNGKIRIAIVKLADLNWVE